MTDSLSVSILPHLYSLSITIWRIYSRGFRPAGRQCAWAPDCFHIHQTTDSPGPGNIVMIEVHCEHVREVFTGFGRQGVSAENVAREAIDGLRTYQAAGVPVGRYLADQLLLPLGIAAWRHGGMAPRASSSRCLSRVIR